MYAVHRKTDASRRMDRHSTDGTTARLGAVAALVFVLALLGFILPGAAAADPCEVADVGGTVVLPPAGCDYLSPDERRSPVARPFRPDSAKRRVAGWEAISTASTPPSSSR